MGAKDDSYRQDGVRVRLARLRRVAYLAAWLYLCAWIVALSLGSVPASARVASVVMAAAALLVIVAVLVAPRPARSSSAASEMHGVSHTK